MEESLGNVLRAARQSSGISVDDAVYLAKIPRAVVEALETEDFGFFTSPLYARSFLKQYSEYVGAHVEPWLDDLVPTTMIDGEAVESFIDISAPIAAVVKPEKSSRGGSGGGAWAALWMILITSGLVWGGIKVYENFEKKLAEKDPVKEELAQPQEIGEKTAGIVEPETPETEQPKKPIAAAEAEPALRAIPVYEEPD